MCSRLIFALDVNSIKDVLHWVFLLSPIVGIFKIGLELFIANGPNILNVVRRAGVHSIFLDIKIHDIPVTMRAVARIVLTYKIDLLTCHCDQAGIFRELNMEDTKLLGVTVLTSLNSQDLTIMGYSGKLTNPLALVLRRARLAIDAGCSGVVCSGIEATAVRAILGPSALIVCPGIRLSNGVCNNDQKRVTSPEGIISAGATHLVVGRAIKNAYNPLKTAIEVIKSIRKNIR